MREQFYFIDSVKINVEREMLKYRLMLHSTIFDEFVILESSVNFAGKWKPLIASEVVHEVMSENPEFAEKFKDGRVTILPVNYTEDEL